MRTCLAAVAGLALLAAPVSAQTPQTAALDELIATQMAGAGFVGLGAAVIVDREVVWSKGYGFADGARSKPFSTGTIMNVASISKPFTGAAMMRAVQDGRLSLDADVSTYLPFRVTNPHHPTETITLRHLATHTSGIKDREEVYGRAYHFGGDSPEPLGRFLEQYFRPDGKDYSRDNFLDAKPGALREYSNIGAALAGYAVERAVGEPLNVYTRKQIFAPLGMKDTGWFLSEIDLAKHSTLFVTQDGWALPIQHYGLTTYPDGGVRTSVADLSKFFVALLSGGEYQGARILDAPIAAEMVRFQFTDGNRPQNYPAADGNSGLFWRTKFNGTRVGHGGNDPGVRADVLAEPAGTVGVVLLVNTTTPDDGPGSKAYAAIFDALWKYAEALRAAKK